MAATLQLEFTGAGVEDENYDLTGLGVIETFKPTRSTNKLVSINSDIPTQITNFANALTADYPREGLILTKDETSLYIEHIDNTYFDGRTGTATNITDTLTTTAQVPTITFSESYGENTSNKCSTVLLTLNFTVSGGGTVEGLRLSRTYGNSLGLETVIYEDVAHNSNTLAIAINRESHINTIAKATIAGNTTTFILNAPKNILEIINVPITPGENSSIVKVNASTFIGSSENQYAIAQSGTTPVYGNMNTFSGITEGEYLVYVKDKYGCSKSEFIKVENVELGRRNNKMEFSKKNCHYYADRLFSELSSPVTALSYDDDYPEKVENFTQVWGQNQITTDQFKSNYFRHEAKLIVCEGGQTKDLEFSIAADLMTDNINQNNFLEGLISQDVNQNNQARIRFVSGDVYDENGVVIGSHDFDGDLPAYYVEGTRIKVFGYDAVITEIKIESSIQYAYIDLPGFGSEQTVIVESIHEALDYEVFEIRLPHTELLGKTYQIEVKAYVNNITTTPSAYWLSERSTVITADELKQGKYHICEFYSENSDKEIDYSIRNYTNIENKTDTKVEPVRITHLRNIPRIRPLSPVPTSENVIEKLGINMVKLDFETIEAYITDFDRLPALYAASLWKLVEESEFCKIDDVLYVGSAEIDREWQYKNVKATVARVTGANEFLSSAQLTKTFYPVKN